MARPTLAQACARYAQRFTADHVPAWARKPCEGNGSFYAPQFASDAEWFANTLFPGERGHHGAGDGCYTTGQTWPHGKWLTAPFAKGQTPGFAQFLRGYTAALLWSSSDEFNGETVNLDQYDTSTAADDHCRAACLAFFEENRADIDAAAQVYDLLKSDGAATGYDMAGHDFALTRNGHGAGYWDGDLPDELGARLTAAATAVGECWPYLGDDGTVYVS